MDTVQSLKDEIQQLKISVQALRTEMDGSHSAQQALIEMNQKQHEELAEFRTLFEATMPKLTCQANARDAVMTFMKQTGLSYPDIDSHTRLQLKYRNVETEYVKTFEIHYKTDCIRGTWMTFNDLHTEETYDALGVNRVVVAFKVKGSARALNGCHVKWQSITEFETMALDKLLSGGRKWTLYKVQRAYDHNEDGDDIFTPLWTVSD